MQKLFGVVLLASVATTANAGHSSDKSLRDPNRVVCRTEDVVGSRLQTKKTCMTAMQWDQMEQQQQRRAVERVQAFKPNSGS